MKDKIRIALSGTEFIDRAHSNAWRQVIPFFEPDLKPILKVVCGRDEGKTKAFARRWGGRGIFDRLADGYREGGCRCSRFVITAISTTRSCHYGREM